jgi:hypothetical protein
MCRLIIHSLVNTLIDLGVAINVMTHETMETLGLTGLRETPTVLQLVDRSTIKPEGILEDVVISIDSWEYPTEFMILQPKTSLGGYPLILGRPWLATVDAYIGCRSGNMTISHGTSTKQLTMYPPTKPNIDFETPLWADGEDSDEEGEAHQVLSIDQYLAIREKTKDDEINDFIASSSPSTNSHVLECYASRNTWLLLPQQVHSPLEHESSPEKDQGSTTKL